MNASARPVTTFVPPGPRGYQHHTGPAGSARVPFRHVYRPLLVAGQNMADSAAVQGVVDRQNGPARVSEDGINALCQQTVDENFSALHGLGPSLQRV